MTCTPASERKKKQKNIIIVRPLATIPYHDNHPTTNHQRTMMNAAAAAAAARSETAAGHFVQDDAFADVNAETRLVMRNRVNPDVNAKYETENVKFLGRLFDNCYHYSELLRPALLNELAAQQAIDCARWTKASHDSKMRDHVRATYR